jgi:hypothetical protein
MQGYMKNIDDLNKRITDAIMTVHADMLLRTYQELAYRLDVVRATTGVHIVVY